MNSLRKLTLLVKEIGIPDLACYALYQLQLRGGIIKRRTPLGGMRSKNELLLESTGQFFNWNSNWNHLVPADGNTLPDEDAHLLLEGLYRPFYGTPQPLVFSTDGQSLLHWTEYTDEKDGSDIKSTWEPARFIWSLSLARAYRLTHDELYPERFWGQFEAFQTANPVNAGPNWSSAQEVALRAVMWILALPSFRHSPHTSQERLAMMNGSIRQHVERLLPTLAYARSQHNNHILSEALGLVLAGDYLKNTDPRARDWIRLGEREFERALLNQIDEKGIYSQHSANYHRMMLQLALLYDARLRKSSRQLPFAVHEKLAAASLWLIHQLDTASGCLPNLGHNDGTLLLSFGCAEYRDYRPTAQAAAIAFLGSPCLPPGRWDELTSWLELDSKAPAAEIGTFFSPAVHRVGTQTTWGSLRGVKFHNRPAHADQLHVELWWDGLNLARDAGTYLYNSPPPWQNAFDRTRLHNTVTVNGLDQMQRVSRFLWLDQAQAVWQESNIPDSISASHNGYRHLGINHRRGLEYLPGNGFRVSDTLNPEPTDAAEYEYCVHWLLPDWNWKLTGQVLTLTRKNKTFMVDISAHSVSNGNSLLPADISLIRAGITLTGQCQDEISGWESDTYGEKHAALSFSFRFKTAGSINMVTNWMLANEKS